MHDHFRCLLTEKQQRRGRRSYRKFIDMGIKAGRNDPTDPDAEKAQELFNKWRDGLKITHVQF